MAGALLGMLAGGALSFGGSKLREKRQQEDMVRQVTLQNVEANPELVNNPIFDKQGKSHFGDAWEAIKFGAQAHQAKLQGEQAQFKQLMAGVAPDAMSFSGGSAQPATAGVPGSPSSGAPAPSMPTHVVGPGMAAAGGLPEGMTREKFFGMPPDQQEAYVRRAAQAKAQTNMGGGAPSAAAPSAPGAAATPTMNPKAELDHLRNIKLGLSQLKDLPELQSKTAISTIDDRIKDLKEEYKVDNSTINALSFAYHGKPFIELPAGGPEQQQIMGQYQQFREDPAVRTFERSQGEWDRRNAIEQRQREQDQDKKDAKAQATHAMTARSTITSFSKMQAAQYESMVKTADSLKKTDPEAAQTFVENQVRMMNEAAAQEEQKYRDDKDSGSLARDFNAPTFNRFNVDPLTKDPGIIAAGKRMFGMGGETVGKIEVRGAKEVAAAGGGPTSPPDAVAVIKDKSGKVTGFRMKDGSVSRP